MRKNLENFEILKINRKNIKEAIYNPRLIDSASEKKLENNLKKKGLLCPLVYNRRTQNLVSGHQRLRLLDKINKTSDYELTIACVDLSEKEEKEQNLFFNNVLAMGSWDKEKLQEVIETLDFKIEETGFDLEDLELLNVDIKMEKQLDEPCELDNYNNFIKNVYSNPQKNKTSDNSDRAQEIKNLKKEIKQNIEKNEKIPPYICIVFDDIQTYSKFKNSNKLDGDFIHIDMLLKNLKSV